MALREQPNFFPALRNAATSYGLAGRLDLAKQSLRVAARESGGPCCQRREEAPMPKAPRDRTRRSKPDYDGHEAKGHEPYDDPEEHLEIERRRFRGGLP